MEIKDMIAQWVRTARKQAKLSGEGLGAKLALELRTTRGHTKGNISHWELGKHEPSVQQLVAISKITGVPLPERIMKTKAAWNFQEEDACSGSNMLSLTDQQFINEVSEAISKRDVPEHVRLAILTLILSSPGKAS